MVPHVIFLLTDDWGWELWPRPGGPHEVLLPQIRQHFVADGLSLARHYTYAYCAPSRQSLLSGRWPIHVNEENSVCSGISRAMSTVADRLTAAGYVSHFVGKWHCGFADPSATPIRRGFSTSLGFYMKAHHHFTHCSYLGYEHARGTHTTCRAAPSNRSAPLYDFFLGADGIEKPLGPAHPPVANQTYSTTLFGQRALDIIRRHDGSSPLFLLLSYSATHQPYLAPDELIRRVGQARRATPAYFKECTYLPRAAFPNLRCNGKQRKVYEAMALAVDDSVGAIASALRERGMYGDSLLVFANDNGGPGGKGPASNQPLRGGKDMLLDGGVRTLAAVGGGWLPPALRGKTSDAFMTLADWYATLRLEIAFDL